MDFDLNLIKNESSDDKSDNPEKIEQKKLKEKQARQIRNVRKWFNGIVSGEISEDPHSKYFRRSDRPWTIKERQQRYKERQKEYPIKEEQLITKRSSAAERQRQYRIRRKMKLEKIREILNFNSTNRLPDVDSGFEHNLIEQDEDKNNSISSQALNQKRYRQKIKLLLQQYEHLISEDAALKQKSALTSAERQKRFRQKKKSIHKISKKLILQQNDIIKFNLTRNDLERLSSRKKIVKLIPKEDICKLLKTKSFNNDNVKINIQSQISPKEKKIIKLIPKDEIHKYIILGNENISEATNKVNLPANSNTVPGVNNDNINGNISSHLIVETFKPNFLDSNTKVENILKDSTLTNSSGSIKIEEMNTVGNRELEEQNSLLEAKISKNKSGENQRNYRQRLKNKLELERLANNTVREEIIKQLQRERQRRYRERKKQAALLAKSMNDSIMDIKEENSNSNVQFKENCQSEEISIVKIESLNSDRICEDFLSHRLENKSDSSMRVDDNTSKPAEYMRIRTCRQRKKNQNNKLQKISIDESVSHSEITNNDGQLSSKSLPMTPAERMRKYRLRQKLKQDFGKVSNSTCKKSLIDEPQVSLRKLGKFNLRYEDGSTVAFNYKSAELEQSSIETDPLQIEGICSS